MRECKYPRTGNCGVMLPDASCVTLKKEKEVEKENGKVGRGDGEEDRI